MESEVKSGEAPAESRAQRLYRIRHSAAHILAQAVLEVFPQARLGIGPPIKDGFYYDFELPRPLTEADLADFEGRMAKIVKANQRFERKVHTRSEAATLMEGSGQSFKVELIQRLPESAEVTTYTNGGFVDLCAGPHVNYTGKVKNFKLLKVSGAYWRGDEKNPMLQRIYGTAWETKEDLDSYLTMLEEARKRDHRKLARELDLAWFHPYSPGGVFWTPRGWILYQTLVAQWRKSHSRAGYVEINNPILYDKALFEESGHWAHYHEHMFMMEAHNRTWCMKPMNCPDTMLFFRSKKRSYRELPLRVSEGGVLHRNEIPGSLSGLTRVRQFTQDDAHIFVAPEQIQSEIQEILALVDETYSTLGMTYELFLSTRPKDSMGTAEEWDNAENALAEGMRAIGKPFKLNPGDGAFYGPKIDFKIRDSLGRQHQTATLQLDFQIPQRFDLHYVASDNTLKRPVVLHRAIYGSLERFIGVLLEHLGGALPTWLAPQQVTVLTISEKASAYGHEVVQVLRAAGLRAELDDRSDKVSFKVREAELLKVPWMLVVGEKEAGDRLVSVRKYQEGVLGTRPLDEVVADLVQRVETRVLDVKVEQLGQWAQDIDEAAAGDSEMEQRGY